jgi:UDP-glucose 4-epimerase
LSDRPAVPITGGACYIGSHDCRALLAAGYHPIAYDNLSTDHRGFVTGSRVVDDLLDKAALARAFAQHPGPGTARLTSSRRKSLCEPARVRRRLRPS